MRSHLTPLLILGIFAFLFMSGSVPVKPDSCRHPRYSTPEPGTCLQPRVYRFLKAIESIEENPVEIHSGQKLLNLLEPRNKLVIDTSFSYGGQEVPLRIYYPDRHSVRNNTPVVLYIHGGGFIAGTLDQYDMTVKKLAKVTGYIYVSPAYRLAPAHPFPQGLDDAYAAWKWLNGNVQSLGGDPDKMYIMGSSAGGNLATVVTLMCRDSAFRMPDAQLLFYPPTTFREDSFPSRVYFMGNHEKEFLLTRDFVMKSKRYYLDGYRNVTNPYLSPLDADLDNSLPPALIQTAQCDPLRDEAKLYYEKLKSAGVRVQYHEYPGMIHGFLSFWMFFPEGKQSMLRVKRFTRFMK